MQEGDKKAVRKADKVIFHVLSSLNYFFVSVDVASMRFPLCSLIPCSSLQAVASLRSDLECVSLRQLQSQDVTRFFRYVMFYPKGFPYISIVKVSKSTSTHRTMPLCTLTRMLSFCS
jgi:hypothetical protein